MQTYRLKLLILAAFLALIGCAQAPVKVSTAEVPALSRPASDVPPACASYAGGWVGTWAQGNFGPLRLWVTAVTPDCVATYAYGSGGLPSTFTTAKILDGTLAITCGVSGTCAFKHSGDELWATYSSTSGNNSGVFKRLSIEGK